MLTPPAVKRIKLSKPRVAQQPLSRRKKLQAKDVANARKLREAVLTSTRTAAREKQLQEISSDDASSQSTIYGPDHDCNVTNFVELISSDENEEFVQQSAFRSAEKRRKPHRFQRKKLFKVPIVTDIAKKIKAKYGLSNITKEFS